MEQVDENAQTLRFERIIAPRTIKVGGDNVRHFVLEPRLVPQFPWRGFAWGFVIGGTAVLLTLLGAMR